MFYEDSEARSVQTIAFLSDFEARSVQTIVFRDGFEAWIVQTIVLRDGFDVLKDKSVFHDCYYGPLFQHFGSGERSKSCWEAFWHTRVITVHVIETLR